jgi:hypothetical protein
VQSILWTRSTTREMPWEYIELYLCRDIYHCTPNELAEQPIETVNMHLKLIGVENIVKQFDSTQGSGGGGPTQ